MIELRAFYSLSHHRETLHKINRVKRNLVSWDFKRVYSTSLYQTLNTGERSEMKKCMRCGRTYEGDERFCASCGNILSDSRASRTGPSAAPAPFDPLRARNRIVLMIALLNVVVFAVFSCCVLWTMFKTVHTTLRIDTINRMLIFTDDMGARAAKSLQAGDMSALQLLQRQAMANPEIAYSFIRDSGGRILISTFEGNAVPDKLKNINELGKGVPFGTQETRLVSDGMVLDIVDIASALADGSQGSLHIGLKADILRSGIRQMLLPVIMFAIVLFIISVGVLVTLISKFANRILR